MQEEIRLRALESYGILEAPTEPAFDRVVEQAAGIFHAPVAFLSLVHRDRLFFKSTFGIEAKESAREGSFCSHAILGRSLFVVPDAAQDPRFAAHPSVASEPRLRFYAGAPLLTPTGVALGALAVMDTSPRSVSPEQGALLETLGVQLVCLFEERRVSLVRDWIGSAIKRELRGKVSSLRSLTSGALRAKRGLEARRMVEILAEIERLDGLLDALRELTQLSLGGALPLRFQSTDVRVLCQEVVEELAAGIGVRFAFESVGDCTGSWDSAVLTRAAMLVVEEAKSRSPHDATVRVRALGEEPGFVLLEVTLPTDLQGPTLRIHLARELILRQGGQIRFRREGDVSIFSICLPRRVD